MKTKILILILAFFACLAGCGKKILWNDCVVYAANAKVVMDAREALDPTYSSEVLLVWSKEGSIGHAFLVYQVGKTLFAYDAEGSRIIKNVDLENWKQSPNGIALQIMGSKLQKAQFAFNPVKI